MANANPYLEHAEKKEEKSAADHLVGVAKNVHTADKTLGAADAVIKTGTSVFAYNAANAVPFATDSAVKAASAAGAKPLGDAVAHGLQEGASHAFKFEWLGNVVGAVVATVYVAKSANEFIHGRNAQGFGKLAKGAVLAGTSVLGISGLAIIPDLAAALFTGKSLSHRAAEAAESGAIHLAGGDKNKESDKHIKDINSVNVPVTTAVLAGGITGAHLTANQITSKDGKPITIGALPKEQGSAITLTGKPVIPSQVMPVNYSPEKMVTQDAPQMITQETHLPLEEEIHPMAGRSPTHWRDKVAAERGQQGRNTKINSDIESARSALIAQNPDLALLNTEIKSTMSKTEIEDARRALLAQNPDLALTAAL